MLSAFMKHFLGTLFITTIVYGKISSDFAPMGLRNAAPLNFANAAPMQKVVRHVAPIQKVDCLFLHGALNLPQRRQGYSPVFRMTPDEMQSLPEEMKDYWGDSITQWAGCASYTFTNFDTVNVSWDNRRLAEYACEAIDLAQKDSTSSYDLRIITHSMGGLILANAIEQRMCSIPDNAQVLGVGVPWLGSEMAYLAADLCKQTENFMVQIFLQGMNICDGRGQLSKSLASIGKLTKQPEEKNRIVSTAQKFVTEVLCGDKMPQMMKGMISRDARKYGIDLNKHDGAVNLQSCMAVNPDVAQVIHKHHLQITGRTNEPQVLQILATDSN